MKSVWKSKRFSEIDEWYTYPRNSKENLSHKSETFNFRVCSTLILFKTYFHNYFQMFFVSHHTVLIRVTKKIYVITYCNAPSVLISCDISGIIQHADLAFHFRHKCKHKLVDTHDRLHFFENKVFWGSCLCFYLEDIWIHLVIWQKFSKQQLKCDSVCPEYYFSEGQSQNLWPHSLLES